MMASDGRTWYQVLQVDPSAEVDVIEGAYRRLARKYHPDVTQADGAHERMVQINEAFRVLRDPETRAAYDATLSANRATGSGYSKRTPDVDPKDTILDGLVLCPSCGRVNFDDRGSCNWCKASLVR